MSAEGCTILMSRPKVFVVIVVGELDVPLVLKHTGTKVFCLTDVEDRRATPWVSKHGG